MSIFPGQPWHDSEEELIQAHAGDVLYDDGTYYWYGENRNADTEVTDAGVVRTDVIGISCYSSRNLTQWKNLGTVLSAVYTEPGHELSPGGILERPRVLKNPITGEYVMFARVSETMEGERKVGVSVATQAAGPFEYRGSFMPGGRPVGDIGVFQDEDGRGYLLYASSNETRLCTVELRDDYMEPVGGETILLENHHTVPALFRSGEDYILLAADAPSFESGRLTCAKSGFLKGPWKVCGNPCEGDEGGDAFDTRCASVLAVHGKENAYVYIADRWNQKDLRDSRYVWIPFRMEEGKPRLQWVDSWDLSYFD